MKPGLVLPRISSVDAVQADRIDDHVRLVAEQINGGLTKENFAPAARLANSMFAESESLYSISCQLSALPAATSTVIGAIAYASRIVSVGWNLSVSQNAYDYRTLNLNSSSAGGLLFVLNIRQPTFLKSVTSSSVSNGLFLLSGLYTADISSWGISAAGSIFSVSSPTDVLTGTVTLTLATPWIS